MFASDVMVRLPLLLPAAVGVNTALKVALCPAPTVAGRFGPVKLKPLPVADALEMVTVEPPLLVTDTVTDLLLPTVTLPKLTLLGFAMREPGVTPVPESAMLRGEPGASEAMARLPVIMPPAAGANFTVNATDWFGVNVVGSASPLTDRPVPVTVACEIVTFDPPVLVNVSERLALLPT